MQQVDATCNKLQKSWTCSTLCNKSTGAIFCQRNTQLVACLRNMLHKHATCCMSGRGISSINLRRHRNKKYLCRSPVITRLCDKYETCVRCRAVRLTRWYGTPTPGRLITKVSTSTTNCAHCQLVTWNVWFQVPASSYWKWSAEVLSELSTRRSGPSSLERLSNLICFHCTVTLQCVYEAFLAPAVCQCFHVVSFDHYL